MTFLSEEDLRSALQYIDPDNREDWLATLMAAHSQDPDANGVTYEIVRAWSAQSPKHTDAEFARTWAGLKQMPEGRGRTIGTLILLANEGEWVRPHKVSGDNKILNKKLQDMERRFNGFPVPDRAFTYFESKGVETPGNARHGPDGVYLPLTDIDDRFRGLQKIHDDGQKKFEEGSDISGAFYEAAWRGPNVQSGEWPTIHIGEGVATAMTLVMAGCGNVIAALNAGNLPKVVRELRLLFPYADIVICGDDDRHNTSNPGRTKAEQAARDYGCKVVFPNFATWNGKQTTDFNDLHQIQGIEEVKRQIRLAAFLLPEQDKTSTPLTIDSCRIAHLLTTQPPPRQYIVNDLLLSGIVAQLIGAGGTAKTMLLLELAVAVAAGLDWATGASGSLGKAVQGGVLMLCGEDAIDELHRRLYDIVMDLRGRYASHVARILAAVSNNLHLRSLVGEDCRLVTGSRTGKSEPTPFVDQIINLASEIPDCKLIIVDPAIRFFAGNENDAADVTRFIEQLERIRAETGGTVICAHHISKAAQREGSASQSAARGSSAFVDNSRAVFQVTVMTQSEAETFGIKEDERQQHVKFSVVKTNYTTACEPVWLKRGLGGVLSFERLDDSDARREEAILHQIAEVVRNHATKDTYFSANQFRDIYGGKKNRFGVGEHALRKYIGLAIAQGYISKRRDPERPNVELLAPPPASALALN